MQPKSLSASSIGVYEKCPARWKAEYIDVRAEQHNSQAADLGTACHGALEDYVVALTSDLDGDPWAFLSAAFDTHYWKLFSDSSRHAEGLKMLKTWLERQDWTGRRVVLTEQKERFDLPTSIGPIPVSYIWDRCDELPGGSIEVVDYKTYSQPVSADDLAHRVQARLYAVAAAIRFPTATKIWVTFDLLRYEPIGAAFSRDDNVETWKYLRGVAERIIADEDAAEHLNDECRWCIRRHKCDALARHIDAGGPLSVTDPFEAGDRREQLTNAKKAIEVLINDLDEFLLGHCRANDLLEFETDTTHVSVGASGRRHADAERVAAVIGAERVAQLGSLSIGVIDGLLKGDELDNEQKSALRQLIGKKYGAPSIKTRPVKKKK